MYIKYWNKYASTTSNEFGSLQGIITMKDILEALVGTLPSDSEDPDIVPRKDGSW